MDCFTKASPMDAYIEKLRYLSENSLGGKIMKIEFDDALAGYQQAKQLQLILDHYSASKHCDESAKALIALMRPDIEAVMTKPEFAELENKQVNPSEPQKPSMMESISSFLHGFMGPSKLEVKLSEQRRQLVERAERAESLSFEALAETADVGKQRDEALARVKELEAQLAEKQ